MDDIQKMIREVFPQKRAVILGDLVADQFLNGTISRVSHEAPVFILRHDATETLPGAAANAAVNVAALGGKATMVGLAGADPNGQLLMKALEPAGVDCTHVITDQRLTTTTKVRVLAGQHYAARQQVIRIDYEDPAALPEDLKEQLIRNMSLAAETADVIIISDYNYGAVFTEIYDAAKDAAKRKGIPLVVDSRYRLTELVGATTATPNREEVEKILGKDFSAEDCSQLRERLGFDALLVTNGNEGMLLFQRDSAAINIPAVGSTTPVDVTGAGDTVIAAYALALASGLSFEGAARVANHAGGIVVMKKRTAAASVDELLGSIESHPEPLALRQIK